MKYYYNIKLTVIFFHNIIKVSNLKREVNLLKENNSHYDIPIIKSTYTSLTPSERKIADFVLKNPKKVIKFSVSELAIETSVGDSTIIRFCRSLGYKSYQDFKLMLAQQMVVPIKNIKENIQEDDDIKTMVEKLSSSNKIIITQTSNFIDLDMLQKTINIISNARKIEFYGVGASGITANDFKHKFMRMGFNCDCFTDPHLQAMSASTLSNKDVVIGISHTGSTKDVVDSCKIAKKSGATVICITAHNRSPITQVADIKLLTAAKDVPLTGGDLHTKIAQLHVLDLLSTGVALANYDRTIEYTKKTAESVLNKLY